MRLICSIISFLLVAPFLSSAQDADAQIRKGNELYAKGEYKKAIAFYEQAQNIDNGNLYAKFNLGNAFFKDGRYPQAAAQYESVVKEDRQGSLKKQSLYNLGNALVKDNKLKQAIDAYKLALREDPADEAVRHNLQKAISEKKKQDPAPSPENRNKPREERENSRNQPARLNKRMIEQYLESIRQKEQEVQQRVQKAKSRGSANQEKDW